MPVRRKIITQTWDNQSLEYLSRLKVSVKYILALKELLEVVADQIAGGEIVLYK